LLGGNRKPASPTSRFTLARNDGQHHCVKDTWQAAGLCIARATDESFTIDPQLCYNARSERLIE
jgi:hypothetical protein